MKIKEFINLWADGEHDDVDVYDNVCGCHQVEVQYEGL